MYKDNKMISIIISSFLHSVILANPVDQATDTVSPSDDTTESSSSEDDEKGRSTGDISPNMCSDNQTQYQYYSSQDANPFVKEHTIVNDSGPIYDDTRQAQSPHTLSSTNLTFDAFSYHDQQSVPVTPQQQTDVPRVNSDRKPYKKTDDIDMQDFIKQVVNKQFANVSALTFFDAAIVYDERDYSEAMKFHNEIMNVLRSRVGEDLRIELFDSEQFAQSKVMVVKDVIDRCSVVLLYLTPNFSTPELNLFVEESIAMTRLGYGQFQSSSYDSRRRWVLKPVHTEPQSRRRYSVPTGLLSLRGINWYDKSKYTLDQIISIFDSAIIERKQREAVATTDFASQHTFGGKIELPQQQNNAPVPAFLNVTLPPEDAGLPPMSHDGFSFHQSLPPVPSPSIPPLSAHQSHVYHQRDVGLPYQYTNSPNINMNQNHHFDGSQLYTHGIIPGGTYAPAMALNQAQIPAATTRLPYPGPTHQILQPGLINNTTPAQTDTRYGFLQSHNAPPSGLQQPMVPSPVPMETYPSIPLHDAQPIYGGQHQHDYYQQRQTSDPSSYQHHSTEFMPGPTNKPTHRTNTPDATPNSTTPLPYASNLSTDDVEIDNYAGVDEKSKHRKQDRRHFPKKSRRKKEKSFHANVVDTDSSSDSSDDDDVQTTVTRRSKNKIINITGCSVVQLGKGNLVTKPKTPVVSFEKPSTMRNDAVKENVPCGHGMATESISEDNMSYTSEMERRVEQQHVASNAVNTHWNISTDTENLRKGDTDMNLTNNLTEKQLNSKLNSKSTLCSDNAQQTQCQSRTKLNVTVDNDTLSASLEDTSRANYSPDTNFNDDELFASGPLDVKTDPPADAVVRNAPFLFSQTRQHVHILPHLVSLNNTTEKITDTSDDSELD